MWAPSSWDESGNALHCALAILDICIARYHVTATHSGWRRLVLGTCRERQMAHQDLMIVPDASSFMLLNSEELARIGGS